MNPLDLAERIAAEADPTVYLRRWAAETVQLPLLERTQERRNRINVMTPMYADAEALVDAALAEAGPKAAKQPPRRQEEVADTAASDTDSRAGSPPPPMPALAEEHDILGCFTKALHRAGVVGEDRFAKLTYLCLTSRVLERPVSLAAKGPLSAGKSRVLERVLAFFPKDASYALTAMSEHAMAYSTEPLEHRFLVLYEAAGLESDFASYLVRRCCLRAASTTRPLRRSRAAACNRGASTAPDRPACWSRRRASTCTPKTRRACCL